MIIPRILAFLNFLLVVVQGGLLRPEATPALRQRATRTSSAPNLAGGQSQTSNAGTISTTIVTNPTDTTQTATLTYPTDASSLVSAIATSVGWAGKCASAVVYGYAQNETIGFVIQNGTRNGEGLTSNTWGIDYAQCKQNCSALPYVSPQVP